MTYTRELSLLPSILRSASTIPTTLHLLASYNLPPTASTLAGQAKVVSLSYTSLGLGGGTCPTACLPALVLACSSGTLLPAWLILKGLDCSGLTVRLSHSPFFTSAAATPPNLLLYYSTTTDIVVNILHLPSFILVRPCAYRSSPVSLAAFSAICPRPPPPRDPSGAFDTQIFWNKIIAQAGSRSIHLDQPASACITRSTHATLISSSIFHITEANPTTPLHTQQPQIPNDHKHRLLIHCFCARSVYIDTSKILALCQDPFHTYHF